MKIVFMGTPEFAVPCLNMLVEEGYDVEAVVTQPDKPKGRGNKLALPPVKEFALKKGLTVLQPHRVKAPEFISILKDINPHLMVTAAYGQLLSREILDVPELGCINVHASLLPKYRGAAPIQWAIINGEKVSGITTMFTDVGMDTGDMLLKREVEITEEMTFGELHDKLSVVGAEVLKETLQKLKDGVLERVPQCDAEATSAPMITKETGRIHWQEPAEKIHNLVRGTNPWPGAFTFYKGERMRVWKTSVDRESRLKQHGAKPGTIFRTGREGLLVAAGSGLIKILEIQFDSGRRMPVEEYIRGHRIDEGEVLG
ncbi:MAG: methionyl-tRNA formyltransferase [Clostridiales bacterium]|jgi:methionyl-tRNA formyltransferase|nr:methionyl-tRNA formyltransferase [Eubacteriales bacterium]MDH7566614.1 methionyl-tRNA formyltransferase [Clostridiales bacterium]